MTREQWEKRLPLIKAFVEGETIQALASDGAWHTLEEGASFNCDLETYRIKPQPKLRPWKPEEVPVGAIIKSGNNRWLLTACWNGKPFMNGSSSNYADEDETPLYLSTLTCKEFTCSVDGGKTWLPCGVVE